MTNAGSTVMTAMRVANGGPVWSLTRPIATFAIQFMQVIRNVIERLFGRHAVAYRVCLVSLQARLRFESLKICRLTTRKKPVRLIGSLDGSKTQQRRAGVYGYPGEKFTLNETEFEITGLRTERWGDISEEDAQREGYPNLKMYQALIERMHQGMDWDQDQPVWVHEFAKVEA